MKSINEKVQIETEWNLKASNIATVALANGIDRNRVEFKEYDDTLQSSYIEIVQIETEWNLKITPILAQHHADESIDRNRVEFKVATASRFSTARKYRQKQSGI